MTRRIASAVVLIVGLGGGAVAYLVQQRAADVSEGVPAEMRYVPATAALVAYVDVGAVMQSDVRRELLPAIESGTQRGRQVMGDLAGIDLEKQVDHILLYVEPSGPLTSSGPDAPKVPPASQAVMLVQGTFEQSRVEQLGLDRGGSLEDYKGRRILMGPAGPEQMALGFVRPDLIAIGQARLVRRTLDVSEAPSHAELRNLIRDASGSVAWVVGYPDAFAGGIGLPNAAPRKMPQVRLASAKADINGGVKATLRAEAADPAAAEQLREAVRGFIALARIQAGARPEFSSVLQSVELSGADKVVQVTFTLTAATLKALAPRQP